LQLPQQVACQHSFWDSAGIHSLSMPFRTRRRFDPSCDAQEHAYYMQKTIFIYWDHNRPGCPISRVFCEGWGFASCGTDTPVRRLWSWFWSYWL